MKWLDSLVNKHKFFRRAALVWACGIITWTVYQTFTVAPAIGAGTASALATVCALLTAVIGFYQWSRDREG